MGPGPARGEGTIKRAAQGAIGRVAQGGDPRTNNAIFAICVVPKTYPYRVTGIDPNLSSPKLCWSNSQPVTMESGIYSAAVLYTNEYDRQHVYFYALFQYDRSVTPPMSIGIDVQKIPSSHDPRDWTF